MEREAQKSLFAPVIDLGPDVEERRGHEGVRDDIDDAEPAGLIHHKYPGRVPGRPRDIHRPCQAASDELPMDLGARGRVGAGAVKRSSLDHDHEEGKDGRPHGHQRLSHGFPLCFWFDRLWFDLEPKKEASPNSILKTIRKSRSPKALPKSLVRLFPPIWPHHDIPRARLSHQDFW